MKSFSLILICIVFLSMCWTLQAQPQREKGGELFFGYAFNRMDREAALEDTGFVQDAKPLNFNGFNFSYNGHIVHTSVTDTLGIAVDVGGYYGSFEEYGEKEDLQIYTVAAGPQFTNRKHKYLQPFVRALFGTSYIKGDLGAGIEDDLGFAFIGGGGVDIKIKDTFAFRMVQLDYLLLRHTSTNINNFRVATGLTVLF